MKVSDLFVQIVFLGLIFLEQHFFYLLEKWVLIALYLAIVTGRRQGHKKGGNAAGNIHVNLEFLS